MYYRRVLLIINVCRCVEPLKRSPGSQQPTPYPLTEPHHFISGKSCGPPEDGVNAYKEVKSELYQGVVTYTCKRGYNTSDPLTRTCNQSAAWDEYPPNCQSKWS